MMKRVLALMLCMVLLLAGVPAAAVAQITEAEELSKQCSKIYRKTLYNTGRSSLNGLCGLMTGYQLWLLDTTRSAEVYDGNGYFDAYAAQQFTSAGNRVRTYPASRYGLAEALYTVTNGGTLPVYNLVACFQWTNTQAGSRYGHAVVIHGILDGNVYFVEGFDTAKGGAAGNTICCTIEEFEEFYDGWTGYEGLVVLGKRDPADFCNVYAADLFICAQKTQLLSQPAETGAEGCSCIRDVNSGEILRATALYTNAMDKAYYRIEDGGTVGYIDATHVRVDRINTENVLLKGELPQALSQGDALRLQGTVLAHSSMLSSVNVTLADAMGIEVCRAEQEVDSRMFHLSRLNCMFEGLSLAPGKYTLTLCAEVKNYTYQNEQAWLQCQEKVLWESQLTVGDMEPAQEVSTTQIPENGWYWDGQTRYYYQDGKPRTGWFCDNGADYYFQKDGAVTTGWVRINGHYRCFTETGVMRTGWVQTSQGMCYMLSNGVAAVGMHQIDGERYYFGAQGLLQTEGTVVVDGVQYQIGEDGVAVPGASAR